MTLVLAVMLAMMLVITGGGWAALHDGGPWQVYAPSLQSYLQVSDTWPIPDPTVSVPLPRYAFAQVSGNTPPVVHAGGDLTVGEGNTVMLSGSAMDTEDNSITYTWSQTGSAAAPRITFANASASSTTFTAPSVTGDTTFTFVLTAHDGTQPATDTLNVTVKETGAAFITTWAVSDSDRDITLPMMGTYSILWGDGSHSPDVDDSQFHSYDAAGIYTVTVLGEGLENIYLYGDAASARQLRSIEQWGDTKWTTMNGAFGRAANMVYNATDAPNLSGVTSMAYMFFNTASFDGNLSGWDVSSVTHMTYMFLGASAFNGDISGWDVSSVTNMYHTFEGASVFSGDISGWDVSSVTDMNSMFFYASAFDGDISGWDVSSVTNMGNMFLGAFSFDVDLSGWDVSSVKAMPSMFISTPIFNQNLGTWYIVPASTDFDASGSSLDVTTISAQNPYLRDQNPIYRIGTGGNSDLFEMRGSTLAFRSTPDVGSYTVKVTASGNGIFENGNNWRMLEITVRSSANDPPTVDAGQDQTVDEGDILTLNGTASDHEGDHLTYLWSHDSALSITVSNATSPLTTFTAPAVDSDATVIFVLSVSDDINTAVTDQVTITIQNVPANEAPTVDAGQDRTVNEGDAVTLNGTASDHEGDHLTYLWSHDSALSITVSNATSPLTTFTAPAVDSDATVIFVLSVSDDINTAVTDQVTITIQNVPANEAPTVDAGQDRTVNEGDAVTLNGTASDHEGDHLTYLWSHDSALSITVSNATSPLTTFTAPAVDSDATVIFVLSVSDDINTAVTDQVTITIQNVPANEAPTVDAGQDRTVNEGDAVTLNGTASDHEGDHLTYLWSHDSALSITVSNATSPLTTFTAPAVDSDATVIFVLSVSDDINTAVTDQVTITIQNVPANEAPTVDAGQDRTVNEGDAVTLNGTASDTEGGQLTYLWSHDSALPITVSNATSQLTTFTAPAVGSDVTVTFVLSVSDGTNTDVTDQVAITIQDVPTNNPPTVDDLQFSFDAGMAYASNNAYPRSTVEINDGTANGPVLSNRDNFGMSVAAIGDLDGDGVPDLAAGASGDDNGGPDRGAVHVMFMNRDGTIRDTVEINSGTANGPVLSTGDRFGVSVVAIGDLDGDGVPDLVVGAYGEDNPGENSGAVHVMFMNRDGTVKDTVVINEGTANGPVLSDSDDFGISVAAIDDLDGDGVPDLVVGANGDRGAGPNSGAVHVMFMNRDGTVKDTVKINSGTANGPVLSAADGFGISVAAIDDLDGDGVPDIAAGAWYDRNSGPDRGAVHVMFMNRDGTVKDTVEINSGTANGPVLSNSDHFGVSVAAIGDFDGDGVPDLAAGAWSDDNGGPDRGAVHVMFMNRDGTVKDTVEINSGTANGPVLSNSDHFGVSVAAIGDFDGDGVPDLAAGALNDDNGGPDRGAVHIIYINDMITNGNGTMPLDAVDTSSPAPVISSSAQGHTNAYSIDFTVDFGEPVDPATFTSSDVHASGGTVSDPLPVNGTTMFVFTISDLAAGNLTVHVPEGGILDPAGNGNTASDPYVIKVDWTHPSPSIYTAATSPVNASSIDFTVDFGEPVDPETFTSSDVHASGGTVSDPLPVNGTTMFVFTVSDLAAGNLTVHVPEGGILDPAGNGNTASDPYVIEVERPRPSPSIYIAARSVNTLSIDFTVDFGEPVDPETFTSSDVHASGGTVSDPLPVNGTTMFVFTISDLAAGNLTVHVPEGGILDPAGNGNTASDPYVIKVDWTHPSPSIYTAATSPVNASSIDFTVDFGEPVDPATFTSSDVHASGGTVSDPLPVNGTTMFVFTVSDLAAGNLTVHVPEGGILDPAGNGNTASNSLTLAVIHFPAGTAPDAGFVTTWKTTTANEEIMIPTDGMGGSYTVTWGDASISTHVVGDQTHVYKEPGTYLVSIYGDFTRIYLPYHPENSLKLLSIEQWGDIRWESMRGAFNGATNMVYRATDTPDLSAVTDTSEMFRFALRFNGNLSNWDVSSVTDMSNMFSIAGAFNGDISTWNVSSVTDMSNMFLATNSFDQNLGNWYVVLHDTSISGANEKLAISAQNAYLDGQNPTYAVDDPRFVVTGGALAIKPGLSVPPGSYEVTVTSTGGFGQGNSKKVEISVGAAQANNPPTVDAGQDQTVDEGDAVTLNGTASDLEGDQLTYLWSHDSVLPITVSNATSQLTTFTAPAVDSDVTVTFVLSVSDGTNTDVTDQVAITIQDVPTNIPPTVDAGQDQVVDEGDAVTLNGTASDLEGDQLTYLWSHDSVLPITVSNATSQLTTFTAPLSDSDTVIAFTLNVTDGAVYVHDTMTVTVRGMPVPDIADVTSITPDGPYHPGQIVDVRINFTRSVNLEAFTIQDGGRDTAGGTFTIMDRPSGLATVQIGDSRYALVSTVYDDGVQIIDITDPASPVAVAAIADGTSYPNLAGGYAITTVQRGNLYYALVASQSNNGVQIINITDPASPTPVAAFNDGATYTELLGAYSITTTQIGDSHYALVTGFSDHGVQIINITDIANPAPAAALQTSRAYSALLSPTSVTTVQIGDSHYALVASKRANGVQIINITDPVRPLPVTALIDGQAYQELEGAYSITTTQIGNLHYALVAADSDDGVQIIDITDPAHPLPVAALTDGQAYPELEGATSITTTQIGDSHYALVASIHDDGVQIIDITDPAHPLPVAALTDGQAYPELEGARTVITTQIGDSHYALVAGVADKGIQIIDITDPAHPFNPLMPYMRMDLDGDRRAAYVGQAHGNHTLIFEYVVKDGDQTGDLAYSGIDALVLGHSGLTDTGDSSNLSNVTLPEPGAPHSLSHNKQIDLRAWPNDPPTVDAGQDQTVNEGDILTLNGTASDADGDAMIYLWSHDSDLEITLDNPSSVSVSFTVPQVTSNATITFTMTVTDKHNATGSDAVVISILDIPADDSQDPIADQFQKNTVVWNMSDPHGSRDIIRITLSSAAPGTIHATWDVPSEAPANYRISWAKAGESYLTWTDPTGNAFPTDPSHTITGLRDDEAYKVKVRASYAGTSGDWSDDVTITVTETVSNTPATGLPVIGGTVQVGQTLTVDTSGIADVNGMVNATLIYQWISSDGATDTDIAEATTSRYILTDGDQGRVIKVQVTFTDDAGHAESRTSDTTLTVAPASTVPGTPTGLNVLQGNSGTLNVSWQIPISDGGSAITGYTIQWKAASGNWTVPADVSEATATGTTHTITGLTDGTPYTVRIIATNHVGDGEPTPESTAIPMTSQQLGPRDIGRVTLSSTTPGVIDSSWVAPTEAPAAYRISWANVGGSYKTWTDLSGNAFTATTSQTITGLERGEAYKVKVRATYAGTSGDWSDDVIITVTETVTNTLAIGPPAVQTGDDQTVGEGDTVTLSGSPTDPDDDPITYTWSQTDPTTPLITFANASAPSTTFTAPSVTGDTVFTLVLTADDGTYSATDTLSITVKETGTAFITTWAASDSDRSITLPMEGTYSVLWGDDTYSADVGGFQSHTYGTVGNYTVTVLGDGLEYIRLYDDSANARQLGSIEQWGDTKWITMDRAFGKAANMVYRATHVPDLSGVTDMTYMFFNAASFDGDLSSWNVSGVTDMSGMFRDTTSFNGNLSAWDVSRVTDMDNVFHGATSFNGDLSAWDVSEVTDMSAMFFEADRFNGNLSAWNVSEVTDMSAMFHDAASFNGDLSAWNVSGVTDMSAMFHGATSFNGDLSAWNVSGVTDMSAMFHEAGRFNGDLSAWNVSGVTDMNTMFDRAHSFNGNLSAWDVSEVTDMSAMFYRATSLNGDLSTWDVSKVTKMIYMFRGATSFNGDISSWDVSRVTEMSGMFHGATSFNGDISSWDVSRVTDMSDMFYRATSFNQNLGAWYVVLDGDTMPSSTDSIGIAAQNRILNDQNPIYTIDEAATNGDKFRIANGTHLALRADQTVAQGQYNVTIKSTGSFGVDNSRIVEITVSEDVVPQTNNPPSVEAGPAQVVSEGSKVRLNGSATDHDGDHLTYSWSHNSTLDISLVNASAPSTTFTAPPVTGDTTFTLVLTADDGTYSATDTLSITVKETSTAFITTWAASDSDRSITLPIKGAYSILWGDGSHSPDVSGSQSHTYGAAAETYTVTVLGKGLESINLRNDTVNALQLRSIEQWGDTKWTVMEEAFDGAVNMVYRATDAPDLSGVTDMSRMFNGASAFNGDISGWNVSSVTDMSSMFNGTAAFNQNLGTWYIVPAGTSPDVTTAISAQNPYLSGQNPTYGMGSGGDSDLFEMRGSILAFKSTPDADSYTANVTASGSAVFESGNNWRVLEITVSGPPAVQAGGNQTVGEGDTVRLSGSATDPNGDSITYAWSQTDPAAPLITFANASAPSTTFTAPQVTGDTVFTLVLTANDGTYSATDTLSITVKETGTAFITTWAASDSDRSITLPIKGAYSILWGDGTYSANVGGFQSHTYGAAAETYTITVLGDGLKRIHLYGDSANARQLGSIEQWGNTKWISMYESFYGAVNMVYRATDAPNLSRVTDMNRMFAGATAFNGNLSGWDVSSVTDMSSMFYTAYAFNGDLSGWDVSSVTTMRYMFFGAHAFNGDLSGWDVSSVTTMNGMFASAHVFNGNLSGWDVSSVTDMGSMFYEAVIFSQPLDGWDVSSVTDMDGMFHSAYTFNQSLDDWDVSSVTYMRNMFYDTVAFNQNLGTWYIVPAGTDFDAGGDSLIVTTVSAQNLYLGDHNLTYGIGSGGDSDLFEMTGSTLAFKSAPNAGSYTVKVTASGNNVFENGNNWRMLEITVHDSADG